MSFLPTCSVRHSGGPKTMTPTSPFPSSRPELGCSAGVVVTMSCPETSFGQSTAMRVPGMTESAGGGCGARCSVIGLALDRAEGQASDEVALEEGVHQHDWYRGYDDHGGMQRCRTQIDEVPDTADVSQGALGLDQPVQ